MYKYTHPQLANTFVNNLNSFQMFMRIIQDRSKPDNLLYRKHIQTQALKW